MYDMSYRSTDAIERNALGERIAVRYNWAVLGWPHIDLCYS